MQQLQHWRDTAIQKSEVISDAWEVAKAYAARVAEWILFFCLIANILEIFPIFPDWFGNIVLIIQSITLDIAGFGLATMGDHARRCGNEKAAITASKMGWWLIGLMILTVSLVTISLLFPTTVAYVDWIEKALILARVIVTVLYGHVIHSLRQVGIEYINEVSTLREEVSTLRKQVDTLQPQVDGGQKQVDTLSGHLQKKTQEVDTLSFQLSTTQKQVDTLQSQVDTKDDDIATLRKQLNEARIEAEGLFMQLDGKQKELVSIREMLEKGQDWQSSQLASLQQELQTEQASASALRRQLSIVQVDVDTLRLQVEGKQQEIERVHFALESGQQEVSTLQQKLDTERQRVSTLQQKINGGQSLQVSSGRVKMDSGHLRNVDSGHDGGQGKVVRLDTTRSRKSGQDEDELAEKIKDLIENSQLSDRAIANQLHCSPTTVGRKRKAMGLAKDDEIVVNE
jgi:predicted  nucleic acid-binding Zn-ribbon protein